MIIQNHYKETYQAAFDERAYAEELFLKSQYKNQADVNLLSENLDKSDTEVRACKEALSRVSRLIVSELRRVHCEKISNIKECISLWLFKNTSMSTKG